jgi:hypothetical protein
MKRSVFFPLAGFALLGALIAGYAGDVTADSGPILEVTVTNVTKGQIFSPFIVAAHTNGLPPLFELGKPASEHLASVAEDAILGPLKSLFESSPQVKDVQVAGGPVPPGESVSVMVSAQGGFVTLVGMAVTTNDAFYALNGVRAPRFGSRTFSSPAYDAGSERNSEDCMYIPGPPCFNAEAHDPAEAEGYVYIHSGIHGIGSLSSDEYDWQNPVAKITIKRVGR